MKAYKYRFDNVLTYRELEKTETEIEYKEAVDDFEAIATELYTLLTKKESVIADQQQKMETGFSIDAIHHYANYIKSLETQIEEIQIQVIQARSKMTWYEEKLLERTLEVRKFEKMKEKDYETYSKEAEYKEAERLDELSTMTFRSVETR